MTVFGKALEDLRALLGMTQGAFARAVGADAAQYSRWKIGRRPPPDDGTIRSWAADLSLRDETVVGLLAAASETRRGGSGSSKALLSAVMTPLIDTVDELMATRPRTLNTIVEEVKPGGLLYGVAHELSQITNPDDAGAFRQVIQAMCGLSANRRRGSTPQQRGRQEPLFPL